jgi:hypothetical protein
MKQAVKLFGMAAVAVSVSFLVLPALADNAHGPGMGRVGSGGPGRNFHGGGFGGGFHGGFGGGFRGRSWGWGGWYPWGFSYVYAPPPYYYYDGYYYDPPAAYYPPPVVYYSQPAVADTSPPPAPVAESPQQPFVDHPLSPTAVDREATPPSPPPAPRPQSPPPIQRSDQGQSIGGVADVKALANAGLSDEVILSHIRNSQTVYHLTTAEIIDLKNSGVSEKVIDFMINTASAHR